MKVLCFDTSGSECIIALCAMGKVIGGEIVVKKDSHLESFVPAINKVLDCSGCSYQELDWIVATRGPGSFTGIRIGIATAEAICVCSNAKLAAVSEFDLWHYCLKEQFDSHSFVVLINAYARQVYLKTFGCGDLDRDPILISSFKVKEYLQSVRAKRLVCGGSGIKVLPEDIYELSNVCFLPRGIGTYKLASFALHAISTGRFISSPTPMYVQPPSVGTPLKLT